MGSAFAIEFTIPAEVRRRECVLFAYGDRLNQVLHEARPECPIEHPHPMEDCGCFERGEERGDG